MLPGGLNGESGLNLLPKEVCIPASNTSTTSHSFIVPKEEEEGVQLGHCASLLALSSTAGWVSCNEEVAIASAHYN